MQDTLNFLSEISKNFPDIIIKAYHRVDTGWMNQIIIVNDNLVFRFPRTNSAVKKLAMELNLLSILKQPPVKLPEYKNIYSQALMNVANRLDKSYDNFFRRIKEKKKGKKIKAGFPRFKSREQYRSITYIQFGFKMLDNTHVFFSKIGKIRMFQHREIRGK